MLLPRSYPRQQRECGARLWIYIHAHNRCIFKYIYIYTYTHTHLKTRKNGGLEDDFPFQLGDFQVSRFFFWGGCICVYIHIIDMTYRYIWSLWIYIKVHIGEVTFFFKGTLTILGCVSHVCLSSYTSDSAVGEWFFSSSFNDTNLSHKLPIELELSVVDNNIIWVHVYYENIHLRYINTHVVT